MSARHGRWGALRTAAVVALFPTAGCGPAAPPPDRVAAIDDVAITHVELEVYLERQVVDGAGTLGSDVLSSLLDRFLDERLLARLAADRLGMAADTDARLAVQALLETVAREPDPQAIVLYYRQQRERFQGAERVHLRQLLFTDRARAEQLRRRWADGLPYDEVLEAVGDDPTAHVGEEGEFSRQGLPPVFADVLFALNDGEVSQVLPADYGFHVFQVVRHLDAGTVPLEDVEESLRAELAGRYRAEALAKLVAEARERYNVRVFERNLPFNYVGSYGSGVDHENS